MLLWRTRLFQEEGLNEKKALKFLLGFIALIAYELFLDGTGIGIKQRWSKLKEWSQRGDIKERLDNETME